MNKSFILAMATVLCSFGAEARMFKYKIACSGKASDGSAATILIDRIGNKDSWDSVTASVFTHKDGKQSLLCEEAWLTGRKGASIDDGFGVDNDLYIECTGERANEVYYRLMLDKKTEGIYQGSFQVGEGIAPFGISRFGGSLDLTCVKVQK